MRYMCLVHFDTTGYVGTTTPEQRQDLDRRSLGYDEELKAKGHYVASEAIEGGDSAVLVRVRQRFLGQLETAEQADQARQHPAAFGAVDGLDLAHAAGGVGMM